MVLHRLHAMMHQNEKSGARAGIGDLFRYLGVAGDQFSVKGLMRWQMVGNQVSTSCDYFLFAGRYQPLLPGRCCRQGFSAGELPAAFASMRHCGRLMLHEYRPLPVPAAINCSCAIPGIVPGKHTRWLLRRRQSLQRHTTHCYRCCSVSSALPWVRYCY